MDPHVAEFVTETGLKSAAYSECYAGLDVSATTCLCFRLDLTLLVTVATALDSILVGGRRQLR